MLFTSRALLSARFTIFYVTWMDSRFFRIGPDAGHVAEVRARAAVIIIVLSLIVLLFTSCYLDWQHDGITETSNFFHKILINFHSSFIVDLQLLKKREIVIIEDNIWNKVIFILYVEFAKLL